MFCTVFARVYEFTKSLLVTSIDGYMCIICFKEHSLTFSLSFSLYITLSSPPRLLSLSLSLSRLDTASNHHAPSHAYLQYSTLPSPLCLSLILSFSHSSYPFCGNIWTDMSCRLFCCSMKPAGWLASSE